MLFRSATQALDVAEKIIETTTEKVQTGLQSQLNRNAAKIESLDQYGVQILNQVEQGRKRVEKILLRPAVLLLTVLNYVYSILKGSSSEVPSTDHISSESKEEELEPQELTLTETYKLVGQRTLEIGPEVVRNSKKIVENWRQALILALNQFPVVSQFGVRLLNLTKPSKLVAENEESLNEKKQN